MNTAKQKPCVDLPKQVHLTCYGMKRGAIIPLNNDYIVNKVKGPAIIASVDQYQAA